MPKYLDINKKVLNAIFMISAEDEETYNSSVNVLLDDYGTSSKTVKSKSSKSKKKKSLFKK